MIYRYTYKITCLKGSWKNKFSFGQHTTDNLNDGYFSCSIRICKYKKKYGLENCKREILAFYDSKEELDKAEYDLIHPWLGHPDCLNIAEGGHGGFTGYHSEETKQKMRDAAKFRPPVSDLTRKRLSEAGMGRKAWNIGIPAWNRGISPTQEQIEKQRASIKEHYKNNECPLKGKKLSEEHRKALSEARKGKHRVYDNEEHTKYHFE